jgi:hypothetical protein
MDNNVFNNVDVCVCWHCCWFVAVSRSISSALTFVCWYCFDMNIVTNIHNINLKTYLILEFMVENVNVVTSASRLEQQIQLETIETKNKNKSKKTNFKHNKWENTIKLEM